MKTKILQESPRVYLLKLDRGEEVIEALTEFAKASAVKGASFQAIGALEEVLFAFWNPETKEYERIGLNEQVEVVSLLGNLSVGDDGEPRVHAHIAVGRRDGRIIGGHLIRGLVLPTLEIFVNDFEASLKRRQDAETKLQLLAVD